MMHVLGLKVWVPVSHILQSALESGIEVRIVQNDLSAAFDEINHHIILYKLCSVGIEDSVLSILTHFCQIDRSPLCWTVIGVNWLTLCQEFYREMFWACYVPLVHLRAFIHSGE